MFMGAPTTLVHKRQGYPYCKERAEVDAVIVQGLSDRPKLNADFGKMVFKDEKSVSKEMAKWFYSLAQAAPHASLKCAEQLRDADLRTDMQAVNQLDLPVAIFHGKHDRVCSFDFAKVMNAGIAGSQLVEFTQSGHALNVEEIQKTNIELVKFIGK